MATDRKDSKIVKLDGSIARYKELTKFKESPKERPASLLKSKGKPYPVEALGKELSAITKEIHHVVQAPIGICAQSVLAAVSYCTQILANVHIDSQVIPLSLYFFTVAQSGERKSAADSIALKPVGDHERILQEQYLSLIKEYEEAISIKETKHTAIKPRDPILVMSEPTFEGLVKVYESGQSSLALFSDEGGHFLSGHAMSADNKLRTVTGLSSLWDGAAISRVRKGDATLKLYNKRLAFHLMIQPGIAYKLFSEKELVDQGFMGRCLIAYPDSTMGDRPYISENIYESPIFKSYSNRISELLTSVSPILRPIKLSAKAQKLYLDAYYRIEHSLSKGGELREISGFANKLLNQVCRIAGVITLYSDDKATEIDEPTFNNACRLMEYYTSENVRLVGESSIKIISLSQEERLIKAQDYLEWLRRPDVQTKQYPDGLLKLRTLMRYGQYRFRDKNTILEMINILSDFGYISPVAGSNNLWEVLDFDE